MTNGLFINEQAFNEEFCGFLWNHLFRRPAMWVGREDFELVCAFINGMISAYGNTGRVAKLQDWNFQEFALNKYGVGKNAVWMSAYTTQPGWSDKSETEKLAVLLKDFEEFVNPLTRMVMELDD